VFQSLRFRLPALFLAGVLLAGIVSAAIAFQLLQSYSEDRSLKELRREAGGLTRLYIPAGTQHMTGSEALSFGAVAEVFTEVLGRPIRWQNPSIWTYRRNMKRAALDPALINVTTVMYLMIRLGLSQTLTGTTEELLGRRPITMRQFVADCAQAWA